MAKPLDQRIDTAGRDKCVTAPHSGEQRLPVEHATGMTREEVEQLELLLSEAKLAPLDADAAACGIDIQLAAADRGSTGACGQFRHRRGWDTHSAQQGADPRHELPRSARHGNECVEAALDQFDAAQFIAARH
jgi:hypothetical protein